MVTGNNNPKIKSIANVQFPDKKSSIVLVFLSYGGKQK
jgi:hypothetical protein